MRQNGVHSILASCACGHEAAISVDALPDFVELPAARRVLSLRRRPVDVRPNWREAHKLGLRNGYEGTSACGSPNRGRPKRKFWR